MEHDYWTTGYSLKKRKSVRVNRFSFLCFFLVVRHFVCNFATEFAALYEFNCCIRD